MAWTPELKAAVQTRQTLSETADSPEPAMEKPIPDPRRIKANTSPAIPSDERKASAILDAHVIGAAKAYCRICNLNFNEGEPLAFALLRTLAGHGSEVPMTKEEYRQQLLERLTTTMFDALGTDPHPSKWPMALEIFAQFLAMAHARVKGLDEETHCSAIARELLAFLEQREAGN